MFIDLKIYLTQMIANTYSHVNVSTVPTVI